MIDQAALGRWVQHWQDNPPAPPSEREARMLRNTFGTIKAANRRAA